MRPFNPRYRWFYVHHTGTMNINILIQWNGNKQIDTKAAIVRPVVNISDGRRLGFLPHIIITIRLHHTLVATDWGRGEILSYRIFSLVSIAHCIWQSLLCHVIMTLLLRTNSWSQLERVMTFIAGNRRTLAALRLTILIGWELVYKPRFETIVGHRGGTDLWRRDILE